MPATGVQGRPHTELQLWLVVVPNWGFEASVRFLRVSWFSFSLFTFMAKLLRWRILNLAVIIVVILENSAGKKQPAPAP